MITDFFFPVIALESRSALGRDGVDVVKSSGSLFPLSSCSAGVAVCCLLIHHCFSPIYFVGIFGILLYL